MTVLPVIERELRAQSRMPSTYGLRVMGAASLILVCLLFSFTDGFRAPLGGKLFLYLNYTLTFSVWMLVPLLCSDCISRERREGTVGLLFLTPLNARDVVMAKGLVQGLKALSLLLAVLPIMSVPLLMGGVSWREALLSIMMNLCSICWALAAGLLGSSLGKSRMRAQLLTGLLVTCLIIVFLLVAGINSQMIRGKILWVPYPAATSFDQAVLAGLLTVTDLNGWWGRMLSMMPAATQTAWLLGQAKLLIFSIGFLLVAIEIAGRNLKRFWRDEPPSARQVWIEKKLFTPVLWVAFLRGWMRRKLERNPIGWLEQRTWSGRLVTWGWFAVMISIYSAAFNNSDVSRALDALQRFMAWLLLGIVAVSAAGSFQRERETGVLELLLVSPMTVGEIIGGRLRGLWGQFLPAFILLLGIWVYLSGIFPGQRTNPGLIEFFCGAFLTLPVIGLYYSLRRSNYIVAFLSTIFTGLVVPYSLMLLINAAIHFILGVNTYYLRDLTQAQSDDSLSTLLFYALLRLTSMPLFITILQLIIAARTGRRLYRDMENRSFAVSRAVT